MELPFVIEPLADRTGFTASLTAPFNVSVAASTPEEAERQLAELVQRRIQEGTILRVLRVPNPAGTAAQAGWLPDDELTRDWLEQVKQYRSECDAADRA